MPDDVGSRLFVTATSGQLKLRNGSGIVVNNSVQPGDAPAPRPAQP